MISGFRSCAFRAPEYPIPSQSRRGIPCWKSWKKSSPGACAERTYFLVHVDGGTEEDEEGGSQKGETQE